MSKFGDQRITFNFAESARAEDFNKINYKLLPAGIYSGGTLSLVGGEPNYASLSPTILYIEDNIEALGIRCETSDVNNVIQGVTTATPYIIARLSWVNSTNVAVNFLASSLGNIHTDDVIIGQATFTGSDVSGFDYSETQYANMSKLIWNRRTNYVVNDLAQVIINNTPVLVEAVQANTGQEPIADLAGSQTYWKIPEFSYQNLLYKDYIQYVIGDIAQVTIDDATTLVVAIQNSKGVDPVTDLAGARLYWEIFSAGGSGQGLVNYIVNPSFERGTKDWEADIGFTLAKEEVDFLRGEVSLQVVKDAADRQNSGFYTEFTIDPADANTELVISFDFKPDVWAADYYAVDLIDVDAAVTLYSINLNSHTVEINPDSDIGHFSTKVSTSANLNYVLKLKVLSSSTSSSTWIFDNFYCAKPLFDEKAEQIVVKGTLGEPCSKGDALYFGTDGLLYVASNDLLATTVVSGLAQADGSISDAMVVVKGGLFTFDSAVLTAGVRYYLGEDGALVTRDAVPSTAYLVSLGVAKSTTELDVTVGMPEWTGRQGNGKIVGEMFKLPVYTSIPGALPFAFDNAVKKALYPELYNRVGDVFEAMHVAAGDSASGADEFYPTPIPGYYERTGRPDITGIDSTSDIDIANDYIYVPSDGYNNYYRGGRNGFPIKIVVESGSLPTSSPQIVDGGEYFVRLGSVGSSFFRLYLTEADAIADTNIINITATATGTFRLTQEGVEIGDALAEHGHDIYVGNTAASFDHPRSANQLALADDAGGRTLKSTIIGSQDIINAVKDTASSNETRPSTLYEFGYIQAESTLPSGETVSALRYDTGWVANSDWTSMDETITHNLNAQVSELLIEVFIRNPTASSEYKIVSVSYNRSDTAAVTHGIVFFSQSSNSIRMFSGAHGIYLLTATGIPYTLATDSWEYKVVVTKPNIIATVTPVPTRSITTDYTFTGMEETINCDMASGTLTVESGLPIGTKFTSRKINSGAGTITTLFTGGETVTKAGLLSVTHTSDGDFWTYEKVSSTRWELVDGFESGSNANGDYWKYWHGKAKCALGLKLQDPNIAIGSIFRSTTSIHTVPITYVSSTYEVTVQTSGNAESHWGNARVASANTVATVIFAPASNTGRPILVFTDGEWY